MIGLSQEGVRSSSKLIPTHLNIPETYHSNFNGILQCSQGYLWLFGNSGILRYDGNQWVHYHQNANQNHQLSSDQILCMTELVNGHIWIGTLNAGVNIYDPVNNQIEILKTDPHYTTMRVYDILENSNRDIWLVTRHRGLLKWSHRDSTLTALGPVKSPSNDEERRVNSIFQLSTDTQDSSILWLAGGDGLYKYSCTDERFEVYYLNELELRQPLRAADQLMERDGQLLIHFWNNRLATFDVQSGKFQLIASAESLPFTKVYRMAAKSPTETWLATDHGLYTFDYLTDSLRQDGHISSNTQVFDIAYMQTGGLITSTSEENRISIVDRDVPTTHSYNLQSFIRNRSVVQKLTGFIRIDQERFMASAFGLQGVLVFDSSMNNISLHEIKEDISYRHKSEYIEHIVDLDGAIWVSGIVDIFRFDPDLGVFDARGRIYGSTLDTYGRPIRDLTQVRKDVLVLDCDDFIIFFDQSTGLTKTLLYNNRSYEDSDSSIRDIKMGKDGNLYVLDDHQLYSIDVSAYVVNWKIDWSTLDINPKAIAVSENGQIHLATTDSGIQMGYYHDGQLELKSSLPLDLSISQQPIYDLHLLKDNDLIIRTQCQSYYYFEQGQSTKLILDDMCLERDLHISEDFVQDDRYYVRTYPYVSEVDISNISMDTTLPNIDLQEINVKGHKYELTLDGRGIPAIDLKYDENFFEIAFNIISLYRGDKVSFSYQLEGYDSHWIEGTTDRSAQYTGMPPGKYNFKIKAANADGYWTGAKELLSIHISPPWWWSPLAKLTWLSLIIGGVSIIYNKRTQSIRNEEAEKYALEKQMTVLELQLLRTQMNPHFLFNSLNSIKNYIIGEKPERAAEHLSNFAHLIRMILQYSRQKTITLEEELEILRLYINLEGLRFESQFSYIESIAHDINCSEVSIPPMILQPFVENAIWHGLLHKEGERRLLLDICKANDKIKISIDDNGIGRAQSLALKDERSGGHQSLGMQITRDRIDLVNNANDVKIAIDIIDKTDKKGHATGTTVVINIPKEESAHEAISQSIRV